MMSGLDFVQKGAPDRWIGNIAYDQLDIRVKRVRTPTLGMYLRMQHIDGDHLAISLRQAGGNGAADKSRAARHHTRSRLGALHQMPSVRGMGAAMPARQDFCGCGGDKVWRGISEMHPTSLTSFRFA